MKKILIMAFFDDNFGDMLIRTNFTQLLKVVLGDLGVEDFRIQAMHLKDIDEHAVKESDLIMFPGGGLFGLSYLGFFDHLQSVIAMAEEENIPVVFSSLGVNNMDADGQNEGPLRDLLKAGCIRSVSVREDPELFRSYADHPSYEIDLVCDPATWTAYTYSHDLPPAEKKAPGAPPLIGINVVRGGLFRANGLDWGIEEEEAYLHDVLQKLESKGWDYRLFTNGSVTDCAALELFAQHYDIPSDRLLLPQTTREMVQAIATFDAVAAIRMHASITAYALGIPSVNLVWNPKIRHFYQNIGFPSRAIEIQDWNAENVLTQLEPLLAGEATDPYPDPEVLMSLFRYLYRTMKAGLRSDHEGETMAFGQVCEQLQKMEVPREEDEIDLRLKLAKAGTHYLKLSNTVERNRETIRELREKRDNLKEKRDSLKEKLRLSREQSEGRRLKNVALQQELKEVKGECRELKKELDRINNKAIVRAYRAIRGTGKKTE